MHLTKEDDILAWGPPRGLPAKLHVPFWSKKANASTKVMPLHTWSEATIEALEDRIKAVDAVDEDDGTSGGFVAEMWLAVHPIYPCRRSGSNGWLLRGQTSHATCKKANTSNSKLL